MADEHRRAVLFDDDWRFFLGHSPGAQDPQHDDSDWRRLDLPHDWSIEDLPPATIESLDVVTGTWRFRKGDDAGWKVPDLDDSDWQQVALPDTWEHHSNYTEDNVYGWFRRKVVIEETWRGRDLVLGLGKIDDVDETFLNGVKIGGMGTFPPAFLSAWHLPRNYPVSRELIRYGRENAIAVRVFDLTLAGGIYQATARHLRSGPFDSHTNGFRDTGYTVGGTGWYRKRFRLPADMVDKRVCVRFDGVYMNADVWINGAHLGNHPYGYTTFAYDITDHLRRDGENVLAVEVKNEGKNSRWYSGSGIYRHVWLTATDPVHVAQWGTYVTTPEVGEKSATVCLRTTVLNETGMTTRVELTTRILHGVGPRLSSDISTGYREPAVGSLRNDHDIAAGASHEFDQRLDIPEPMLWDVDSPVLYEAVTTVSVAGREVDRVVTPFGIRTISVDPANGFRLNGRTLKLKGACMHHDNGCLGACAYDRAEERRVEIMKRNGYNAIRTAHNPPSPAFLDACDRLGMLVIDEAFDCWNEGKNADDYHRWFPYWWQRDLDSMILRDRNHPCIVIWSIGNEIMEQGKPLGVETSRMLAARARELDPTRPVTAALSFGDIWETLDANFATLDVGGYNYQVDKYEADQVRAPGRIVAATESFPIKAFEYWTAVLKHPYVIGDFVWTGFDYLGEAGIGWKSSDFPWNTAFCGDIDLCGFKRPASYYRDALWGDESAPSIFVACPTPTFGEAPTSGWRWDDVIDSWTWPGWEGKELSVEVYSSCDRVRLYLNDKDLGCKDVSAATRLIARWAVPYERGVLKAIGYRGDQQIVHELRTASTPAQIRLTADRTTINADGRDLSFITVELLDDAGVRHPAADDLVTFRVEGEGMIAGVGNGDPTSTESFQQPRRRAFGGRCLVVVKSIRGVGAIRLTAAAEGMRPGSIEIASIAHRKS